MWQKKLQAGLSLNYVFGVAYYQNEMAEIIINFNPNQCFH
jgi:hypothetical protein